MFLSLNSQTPSSLRPKRKRSVTISDYVEDISNSKRRRVEEAPSNQSTAIQNVVHNECGAKPTMAIMDEQVQNLKLELKEIKERLARVEQESFRKTRVISTVIELTHCSICKEPVRNPYTLECGHSSCYKCLRQWWLTSQPQSTINPAAAASSDEESDDEEVTIHRGPQHHYSDFSIPSTPNSSRHCPECRQPTTRRPVLDYRLRDIVDALQPSPLSSMTQTKRNERWGRIRRKDAWKAIFPSNADGSAIRSAPLATQPPYIILPSIAQGQIGTPLPSFFRSTRTNGSVHQQHDQHRTARRSQPYSITHPARRERRRLEPYDPVRELEARGVTEEQRERQAHLRPSPSSSSPQNEHARAHLQPASLSSWPLDLSFLDDSSPDIPPSPHVRSLEPQLRTTPESSSASVESQPSQPRQLTSSPFRSQPYLQLPSIHELLSLPPSSDMTLPPILDNLPTTFELSRTSGYHRRSDIRSESDRGSRENQSEEEETNGTDTLPNSSNTIGDDIWIGVDLED